jgi:hypothetical protein
LRKTVEDHVSECEFLVGDDSCRAVKESDMGALRKDKCQNTIKDACCYKCSLRVNCEISCDLLDKTNEEEVPEKSQSVEQEIASDYDSQGECGNCLYYMKRKCPRHYDHDTELWRKQDACRIFQPADKTGH